MKTIKNRLKKLNKIALDDEIDIVFLTQIDNEHFEVRYRKCSKNKDLIKVYRTKEEAGKAISEIERSKPLTIFWDDILFSSGE